MKGRKRMLTGLDAYLQPSEILDFNDPEVAALARRLAAGSPGPCETARRCFEWVRDEIKHSVDYRLNPVTCRASEVLRHGAGFCYAKSHLLAALLRACGLPAGLCYQRLSMDDAGARFALHGLVAVCLPEVGWYRIDPRGNRPGIDAQFTPPVERLAFSPAQAGEADFPTIHPFPLPGVVTALRAHRTWDALARNLPDLTPEAACFDQSSGFFKAKA